MSAFLLTLAALAADVSLTKTALVVDGEPVLDAERHKRGVGQVTWFFSHDGEWVLQIDRSRYNLRETQLTATLHPSQDMFVGRFRANEEDLVDELVQEGVITGSEVDADAFRRFAEERGLTVANPNALASLQYLAVENRCPRDRSLVVHGAEGAKEEWLAPQAWTTVSLHAGDRVCLEGTSQCTGVTSTLHTVAVSLSCDRLE